jgi:sialate O-acetylesterase
VHLDHAVPALNALGLRATFYLSVNAPDVRTRLGDWKNVAKAGHELGNHTIYHPCDASKPGRSWVLPENDLSKYTTSEFLREVTMTNTFLQSLDGKTERTFAFPCGDTHAGEGSFVDAIKNQFVSMRGVEGRLNNLNNLDLTNIHCYVVDEKNSDQLITWAEKAAQENALLVILFHGVGGGHSLNVNLDIHNKFLSYLKDHGDDYWVTTMLEASKHSIQRLKK